MPPPNEPSLDALLGFVAISNVQHGDEILTQLCLQSLVLFPDEPITSGQELCEVLSSAFGVTISSSRVQLALDRLVSHTQVTRLPGSNQYSATAYERTRIKGRISSARSLQDRVKATWLAQSKTKFGEEFDGQTAWECLQRYLSALFRRHGLQTVALLDARGAATQGASPALKASLDDILAELKCGDGQRKVLENAIHLFLSNVGSESDRTTFIVQLADGAFSFYSLSAPPEVSARLQSKLNELTLFLDTNFLFGILGLHVNPFDDVSEELMAVISREKLPFKLRYHASTLDEMHRTIVGITSGLKGRHWPQSVSRAALRSPYITGIEKKFHERNATQIVDPAIFFQPFDHPDVLLKDKGIVIYRTSADRLQERAELINHYKEFLKTRHREKPYEAIDHDMTVLDCVRHQRSTATSSLDAKGLIITCDTFLSRFDWHELRNTDELACTVLPNQFLQLLRPFISSSPEFDKSFAESFAIAEFRTVSSSSEATTKLLSLLASYKDIREETASKLVANELLLDKLKGSKDDAQFKLHVDAALAADNAQLIEELVAAKHQAEREREERETRDKEREVFEKQLKDERDGLLDERTTLTDRVGALTSELESIQTESVAAIGELKDSVATTQGRLDNIVHVLRVGIAVVCALGAILGGEYLIARYQWAWLSNHPNSYSLRLSAYLFVITFFLGLFKSDWRKYFWTGSVGCFALLLVLIGLLGGPKK